MVSLDGDDGEERLPYSDLEAVQEAIRHVENLAFHHNPQGSVERGHYDALVALERRMNDAAKANAPQVSTDERKARLARRSVDDRDLK